MDPVTMAWLNFGVAAGSYLLHAWSAYRSSRPSPTTPAVVPVQPLIPGTNTPSPGTAPLSQPVNVNAPPGHIMIGHGELLQALGGFAASLLNGAQPLQAAPISPAGTAQSNVPAIQPTVQPAQASQQPPIDVNALVTQLISLAHQSRPQPASPPIAAAPAAPSPAAAGS